MLEIVPLTLDKFVDMCRQPGFAFVRFGDGEFQCLAGVEGENCDGVVYTPEMAQGMLEVLRNPDLCHSISTIALEQADPVAVLQQHGLQVKWHALDFLYEASRRGRLYPLIEFLRTRRIVMVGPRHLLRFKAFPVEEFITCPLPHAFKVLDLLERDIARTVEAHNANAVLISAGLATSKILVHRLHSTFPDLLLLDTGSLWDMYVGELSRSSARELGKKRIRELGRLNFGREIASWWTT